MSVLAHVFERAGLATTLVALVYDHALGQKPPRAVWVPYWYGRTFGAPNQPDLQMRVLRAALDLLDRPSGPVLETYEEEPPPTADPDAWSPSWDIEPVDEAISDAELALRFRHDLSVLAPLHAEATRAHGWSTFGLAGLSFQELEEIFVSYLLKGPTDNIPKRERAFVIKHGSQDLTDAFSQTAAYLGGDAPFAIRRWYWTRSSFGLVMRRIGEALHDDPDAKTRVAADGLFVPREWNL